MVFLLIDIIVSAAIWLYIAFRGVKELQYTSFVNVITGVFRGYQRTCIGDNFFEFCTNGIVNV